MKTVFHTISVLAFCVTAAVSYAMAQAPGFDRYEVILDRMPFGSEPADPLPGQAGNQPLTLAESFAKNLKMCAITHHVISGKLQVGLIDNVTKKNYFLKIGDQEDGIEVVDADYKGERVLLRKGTEEVWLGMNEEANSAKAPAASLAQTPRAGAGRVMPPSRHTNPRRENASPPPKPPPESIYKGEALAKHLEQYQMELIRAKGEKGPILPLELTPEMDNQLVAEGVLPPQE